MLRVKDLDRSVDFYTKLLGMKELRRREVPDGKYTLAFVGYGDESAQTVLELTYNWDQTERLRPRHRLRPSRGRPARRLQGLRGAEARAAPRSPASRAR